MNYTQQTKAVYWEDIEKQLESIFYRIVFAPVISILEETSAQIDPDILLNANNTPLIMALRSGRIQYANGTFSGQFSSSLSRILQGIGAKWNKRLQVYTLSPAKVPAWVTAESGRYRTMAKEAHQRVKDALKRVKEHLMDAITDNPVRPSKSLKHMERDFAPIAKSLEVSPVLSPEAHQNLEESYAEDMKKYILEHCNQSTDDLFDVVERNAQQGYRFDQLARSIKSRYSVSQNKAKFLARQQTALYMSKFRQERFKEAGVRTYQWSTSRDERVRSDHKKLNGKVFSYDSPPIVDSLTGRRANPGEDFNCRCLDIPILKSMREAA